MSAPYRIANAGGFWGDRSDALAAQVMGGPVDVVMLDYLAEVTMSILRRQMQRDPAAGWAKDFVLALEPALDKVVEQGIVVVTNAGGMNPRACAAAIVDLAKKRGHRGLSIGIVTGDDLMPALDDILASGVGLSHMDTGEPLAPVRARVQSANAYLGGAPIAEAIRRGARIVVTGRTTDSALALGPLLAHFDWPAHDFDRVAAGVVAGHLLECGAQVTGGNSIAAWPNVPRIEDIGFPIAEVSSNGDFVVTKHASLGGLVTMATVKEQLLYEIGDPRAYLTPDVSADFTSLSLEDAGSDRVLVRGVRGRPPPSQLKASIAVQGGFRTAAAITFVAPDAAARARDAERILLARCAKLGIALEAHHVDWIGVNGAHGPMAAAPVGETNEILFRIAVRTRERADAERFAREIAPLFLCGPPGMSAGPSFDGRPEPQPIVDFWPALLPASLVTPVVEILSS